MGVMEGLPEEVTEHILNMSGGVPLNLQQMTRAFVGSDMLFLGGDGSYELEGTMESLKLPTNLQDSLRMRLAGVEASDPPLHLLLQLMACMGGAAAQHLLPPVWHIVGDEVPGQEVEAALGRGVAAGPQPVVQLGLKCCMGLCYCMGYRSYRESGAVIVLTIIPDVHRHFDRK